MFDPTRNTGILLEDVGLIFKNFSGSASQMNSAGQRNINIVLNPEHAEELATYGFPVREWSPKPSEDEPEPPIFLLLKVNIKYSGARPPRVRMVGSTSRKITELTEDTISLLDSAEIVSTDIVVRPYNYEIRGETGVSAYAQNMVCVVVEDPLDLKWTFQDGDDEPVANA